MQCLLVLALGGPAKSDDDAQWGYFMVRSTLAQAVSRASSELAAKGIGAHSSSVLLQLVRQIASRLSVQISEQVAAKSIPALGAVFGAAINAAFIDHFQQIADAHFTVRGLERKYGAPQVRAQWDALPG
jgi:EcsC protein family